jgi:hypothetical protein
VLTGPDLLACVSARRQLRTSSYRSQTKGRMCSARQRHPEVSGHGTICWLKAGGGIGGTSHTRCRVRIFAQMIASRSQSDTKPKCSAVAIRRSPPRPVRFRSFNNKCRVSPVSPNSSPQPDRGKRPLLSVFVVLRARTAFRQILI